MAATVPIETRIVRISTGASNAEICEQLCAALDELATKHDDTDLSRLASAARDHIAWWDLREDIDDGFEDDDDDDA